MYLANMRVSVIRALIFPMLFRARPADAETSVMRRLGSSASCWQIQSSSVVVLPAPGQMLTRTISRGLALSHACTICC